MVIRTRIVTGRCAATVVLAGSALLALAGCNDALDALPANQPPVVTSLQASATSGGAPLAVDFTAAAGDSDGAVVSFQYEFGDGTMSVASASPGASHTYTANGAYAATVLAMDDRGDVGARSVQIIVGGGATGVSFTGDVLPLFSAFNPNGSPCTACHTSSNVLDLSGSAAQVYSELVNETTTRVQTGNPPASLVLSRPTGTASHVIRWSTSDPAYTKVLQWIQSGAPYN